MIDSTGNCWIVKVPITYGGYTLERDSVILFLGVYNGWSELLADGHFRSYPSNFFQRVLHGGALTCIEYEKPCAQLDNLG